ncbi:MAG TPA: RodZ domain-containing protein [Terriglobia bacterium]|nr:RodZ domain-containing protein [Terriglobia bacterium]
MPAFGENLRREREMRGVSLEEISSATKISMRFLEAIEREEFSKLPGGIFSRSFIRTYARYLGLDEERVVAEYQLAAHPQVDFDLHRMPGGKSSSGRPAARTPLIATLVAVVLLAGGYVLFRYSPRAAEAPPPPAPVATPKPAAPPTEPAPMASGNATAVPGVNPAAGEMTPGAAHGTSTAAGATPYPQGGPAAGVNPAAQSGPQTGNPPGTKPATDTDLLLQVAATERAWVAVDADGKTVLQRVLNPDEVQTLKAHKSFDVTTGNAQAIILTLNGETLKPLGRHGEVKSVHLTREDLKNSAP